MSVSIVCSEAGGSRCGVGVAFTDTIETLGLPFREDCKLQTQPSTYTETRGQEMFEMLKVKII